MRLTACIAQVRAVESLEVAQLFSCLGRVKHLEFCCRSEYLLCALDKKPVQVRSPTPLSVHSSSRLSGAKRQDGPSLVQVWSVSDPDWACSIEEGAAGVQHARWAPDGQHVLVVSDFQIRTSVWSLVTKQCAHFLRSTQSTFRATFTQCAVPQACTSQDPSCLRTA